MKTAVASPLKLHKLSKFYGKSRGIEGITLEVKPGEVFGFLGPNGAGKTTAIRTILDFLRPTDGRASVFGLDSVKDSVAIKDRVGYLAGDIALYENLTGRQLLEYLTSLGRATDWAYVDVLASQLQAELDRPIKNLSKGNVQKLGLIQAFMHHPQLLILDEPTSGLDPLMQQVFYSLVQQVKAEGTTVFISSHNLTEVQKVCDRAAFIRTGKLIAVEGVAHAKHLALHRFDVWFGKPIPQGAFNKVAGVTDVTQHDDFVRISVRGAIDPLIKALGNYHVVNLVQEETTLEELFMHYYQEASHA